MNCEELQRSNLALRWQPTFGHAAMVERNGIAASGDLGSHAANDEVLTLNDEDEGGPSFDRGEVRQGERNRDQ